MKIYKSKLDWWLVVLILTVTVCPVVLAIMEREYAAIVISGFTLSLIGLTFYYTRYKIKGQQLIVWWTKIDINSIKKIEKSNSFLSAPALSLDRIEISYNKYDSILISPKDKQGFVDELLKVNPSIDVRI